MQISVKLTGVLKSKTPAGDKLDLPEGATIESALSLLDIPAQRIQVVTINGTLERDLKRALEPDDEMTVLAPVGGG